MAWGLGAVFTLKIRRIEKSHTTYGGVALLALGGVSPLDQRLHDERKWTEVAQRVRKARASTVVWPL
jgi:hypothetical protein